MEGAATAPVLNSRLDSTTTEDDPHWNGGTVTARYSRFVPSLKLLSRKKKRYSRWDKSWESQCPYISCELIGSMLEMARAFAFQGRTQIRSVDSVRWLRQLQSNASHDVCRHLDRTNAVSVHGGCGGFKRDRVASHAKTFQLVTASGKRA